MNINVGRKCGHGSDPKAPGLGRWGKDDGSARSTTSRRRIRRPRQADQARQVFALGIPLAASGPQRGLFGKRWNPIHTMLATGTDALAGRQEPGCSTADDALNMPIQSATHWDSLGHIFYHDKMYNGHHASNVDSNGVASSASSTPRTSWWAAACCSTSPAGRASTR